MMRQPFKVDPLRLLADQRRFAIAGAAADQHDRVAHQLFRGLHRRLAQRLVAADDQRIVNAFGLNPALCDMRTLPAARAAQIALRRLATGLQPRGDTPLARFA